MVLDVVMTLAMNRQRGILCSNDIRLEDLGFADDLCLLTHGFEDMTAKPKDLKTETA